MKFVPAFAALAGLATAWLAPAPGHAAAVTATARAHAAVLHPLSLVLKGDLDFGTIASNGAGSVVIEPNSNVMTASGGVVPLGGAPTAAAFIGAAGSASVVIIRIPKQPILITRAGGTETLSVRDFTLQGQDKRTLARQESFEFRVGARLVVPANQIDGTYVGNFDVTVHYP